MWTHIELMKKCKIVAIVHSLSDKPAVPSTKKLGEFRKSSAQQNTSTGEYANLSPDTHPNCLCNLYVCGNVRFKEHILYIYWTST